MTATTHLYPAAPTVPAAAMLAHQHALALMPKVSGSLSVVFSVMIIQKVLTDKQRCQRIYHRLLLGISKMISIKYTPVRHGLRSAIQLLLY